LVKASLDSGALKTESDTLATIANGVAGAADTIANFDTTTLTSTKSAITSAKTSIDTGLKKPLANFYGTLVDNPNDYFKQVKDAGTSFLIASIIVIIVLTIIYFVILFMNIRDKWHKAKCISKIIMLLQLLLAVLILIMSIIGVVVGVIIAYICTFTDGVISQPNFLSTKFKSLNLPTQMATILNTCVYSKGNGDLFAALGMDLSSINNVNSITNGLQSFTTLQSNLTSQTAPLIGGWLSGNITGGISYDIQLRGVPQEQDLTTGLDKVNAYGCNSDVMVFKNCASGKVASTTADSATAGIGTTTYCMRHPSLSTTHYSGRYTSGDTCASGTFSDANTVVANTATAADLHKTKLDNMNNDFNNGFYNAEKAVFDKMVSSVNDLNSILAKVQSAITSLNNLGSTLTQLTNCTIVRKEFIMFENVICFRIGEDYYQQTNVGIALGFLLFVYSWFMCCTIRLANKQSTEGENKGGNDIYREEQKNEMPQEQNGNQYDNYQ
jgi:hypothetical protein